MIYDKLSNISEYEALSDNFKKAIEYITQNDISQLEPGRYEIDGDNAYFMIQEYETKQQKDANFESHLEYADLQLILEGDEKIGFTIKYDHEGTKIESKVDYYLYDLTPDFFLTLQKNEFVICMPEDIHMACVRNTAEHVKKAVIKIKL